jgi:hypothetical protein
MKQMQGFRGTFARSRRPRRGSFIFALALCVYAPDLAAAQTTKAIPDLSGQWVRIGRYVESFDAPPSGPGPMMIDPAHPHRRSATPGGQSPDGWVADLRNPILKPETLARMRSIVEAEIAGHSHLKLIDMCYPAGVPMILNQRDPVQILQSADKVILVYLRDALTRHIYLNQPHAANLKHTWFGESVGHYEDDTLVVDTVGENARTYTDRFFTPHSDKIHVIERYKVSPDRKTMQVLLTVDDPETFTTPWSAQVTYRADRTPYEEVVCAENNRDFGSGLITESNRIPGPYPASPPVAAQPDF